MRILKNDEVNKNMIEQIRKTILSESKEVKQLLGIKYNNITSEIPIKSRGFNIWVLCSDDNRIIGFLSFSNIKDAMFIKLLYIMPIFRSQGFGRYFLNYLYENYSKLVCKINQGNNLMYGLVKSIGMRGEKSIISGITPLNSQPIWWSNYKTDDKYL